MIELNTKIGLLKDEYLLLQKFYEDFDARLITIKGWSATIGLAAIGGGFYEDHFLWLFAAGAALVFWIIEALWKSFQYKYADRITAIEATFRSGKFDEISPFQIYASWFDAFERSGFGLLDAMKMGVVFFPHAVIFIFGLSLFFLRHFGVITCGK